MVRIAAAAALAGIAGAAQGQVIQFMSQIRGLDAGTPSPAVGVLAGELDVGDRSFLFFYSISENLIGEPASPGAHIHEGYEGESGPIVFPFETGAWPLVGGYAWTGMTDEQMARLIDGGYYINFHTTAFPAGEIRGQLLAVPAPGGAALLALGAPLAAVRRRRGV